MPAPPGNRGLTVRAHANPDLLPVMRIEQSRRWPPFSGGFLVRQSMDCQAFTKGTLTLMYEAVRGALASDDAQEQRGEDPRFRVRETPEWKKHAADLEAEMLKRAMLFSVIEWHDGQEKLPFG